MNWWWPRGIDCSRFGPRRLVSKTSLIFGWIKTKLSFEIGSRYRLGIIPSSNPEVLSSKPRVSMERIVEEEERQPEELECIERPAVLSLLRCCLYLKHGESGRSCGRGSCWTQASCELTCGLCIVQPRVSGCYLRRKRSHFPRRDGIHSKWCLPHPHWQLQALNTREGAFDIGYWQIWQVDSQRRGIQPDSKPFKLHLKWVLISNS